MVGIGRRVHGLGAAGLGMVLLFWRAFPADWITVPANLAGYQILLWATGVLLILAGLASLLLRRAPAAGLILAALFAAWMVAADLPAAAAQPRVWVVWQGTAESAAMALGGVLAWTLGFAGEGNGGARTALLARWAFGLCLLVFGVSHFAYAKFTASLVPAWLPPSQLTWVWATGVAQIAAGVAMLSGVLAPLAAVLLTIMYVIFGALVQAPTVISHPASQSNWTENAINLVLVGAAWTLADCLWRRRTRRRTAAAGEIGAAAAESG
ncbi:MAG: DoxX family membrane protein [Caulobacteraceae bacterium]